MRPDHWKQLTTLAEAQFSLVTADQVDAIGVGERTRNRAVDAGYLVPVRRSVLAVAGAPPSPWRSLMAAYLAAGAVGVVASHRAAAGLHCFPGVLPGAVELTVHDGRRLRLDGVRCHSTNELGGDQIVRAGPFAATSPARTVVDLAGDLDRHLLGRIVSHVCRKRLCSERDLDRLLHRVGGPGRPGTRLLRSILADRAGGDSDLEERWLRLLINAGLRPPALQYQVVVGGRVLLLDFAWPLFKVGIEVDGWDPHRERHVWDHDHDKINAYLEAGWRVLFVTSRTRPEHVFRPLRAFIVQ
ncbi:MAG: hypothetical protein ACRD0N_04885 [Acidimicrobiales bacterium]